MKGSLKEFVKIAVGLREHPKILEAGDDAGWLYVCAIMWSKEHDTDGFIPEYALARLTGKRNPSRLVSRLVSVRLFDVTDNGWLIHDYLQVQESSAARKAAAKTAAKARWDKEKGLPSALESHADGNADAMRDRNAEEEEEKEEEIPPTPPGGNRGRDQVRFRADLEAWVSEHFADLPRDAVFGVVAKFNSLRRPLDAESVRAAVLAQHPYLAKEKAA